MPPVPEIRKPPTAPRDLSIALDLFLCGMTGDLDGDHAAVRRQHVEVMRGRGLREHRAERALPPVRAATILSAMT